MYINKKYLKKVENILTNQMQNGIIRKYLARDKNISKIYNFFNMKNNKNNIDKEKNLLLIYYFFTLKRALKINWKNLKNMLTSRAKSSTIWIVRNKKRVEQKVHWKVNNKPLRNQSKR